MTANILPSAAPKWAVRIWADERNIYAELPSINQPAVLSFSRSEDGLSRALHLLGAMQCEYAGEAYVRPPLIPKDLQAKGITPADMAAARSALKKLGII